MLLTVLSNELILQMKFQILLLLRYRQGFLYIYGVGVGVYFCYGYLNFVPRWNLSQLLCSTGIIRPKLNVNKCIVEVFKIHCSWIGPDFDSELQLKLVACKIIWTLFYVTDIVINILLCSDIQTWICFSCEGQNPYVFTIYDYTLIFFFNVLLL